MHRRPLTCPAGPYGPPVGGIERNPLVSLGQDGPLSPGPHPMGQYDEALSYLPVGWRLGGAVGSPSACSDHRARVVCTCEEPEPEATPFEPPEAGGRSRREPGLPLCRASYWASYSGWASYWASYSGCCVIPPPLRLLLGFVQWMCLLLGFIQWMQRGRGHRRQSPRVDGAAAQATGRDGLLPSVQ